jgi:Protein of unknown function (DUF3489)
MKRGNCRLKKDTTTMTTSIPQEQTEKNVPRAKKKVGVAKRRANVATPKAKAARKAAPANKPATARHGSKTAKILELLKRPTGVTLKELMKATTWQAHSVCGFLSGTVIKRMGIPVESSLSADSERVYRASK